MVKNTHPDQKQDHDALKRRPIHQKVEHSAENQSQALNPESPVGDETDDSSEELHEENENHRDGVLNKEELRNIRNEVKFGKKHLSDVPRTSTSFYNNFWAYFKFGFVMFVLLLVCVFCYILGIQKPVAELSLNEKLKKMQNIFQDQNNLTFRILENALKKVVNVTDEPSAPAIFTVTVNKNAIYKSHEFSRHLAENLAPQSVVFINESVSWRGNPDGIKLKIDNEIQSVAKSKDLFVVVVDNLQNVPPKGAMIFHSYCDHESAPFKQAVFLFILPLDEVLPKETISKKIDGSAFQQLKNIWHYASSDEIDSLITRITVNVINIR